MGHIFSYLHVDHIFFSIFDTLILYIYIVIQGFGFNHIFSTIEIASSTNIELLTLIIDFFCNGNDSRI